MDPDAALAAARECLARIDDTDDTETINDAAFEALELFRALDEWLSKGGFRPRAWERSNPCHG